ncbi:MAG: molybdopterin biosynthesis protein [Acidobacteriota bacterium]
MRREKQFYRRLKTLEEARRIFFSRFASLSTEAETLQVRSALNRILTRPVKARLSVPAYHAAAMDGLAVRASSTFGARPEAPIFIQGGSGAVPVNTGDPLPEETDAVVLIEDVEEADGRWEIREGAYPWQNVRKAGEDMVAGEVLLPARHRIRPFDQGALLAAGVLAVEVFRRPRVLIIPTGDEVIAPEEAPERIPAGTILEVNGQVLASMVAECGAEATLARPVPDNRDRLREAVTAGFSGGYDLILMIAGSSAGSEDYTPSLFEEIGELLVHGVTVMPGKPTLLACVGDRPVVGIPGYPVSAVVGFREFVRPLLYMMQGTFPPEPESVSAMMARKLPSKVGVEEHVRVLAGRVGGMMTAVPLSGGAGALSSLFRADGIVRIAQDVSGLAEGETVNVECFAPVEALSNKLLAIGSHDLTLDVVASMIKERSGGRITMSSSNVGSLGGLFAVGKGVAHLAGSHLLDTQRGDYNRSFIRKHLAQTPVALITLVHRWQGFLVAKGNPKGIQGIRDLARPDVSFINRQGGSGTRILLDYEMEKAGVGADSVIGYRNEEYTHMGVAMAVLSGRADVGLGILAAAQALDLDFIPVTRERYDLVIPRAFLADEKIELLLAVVRSKEFSDQALALGGYEVHETGREVDLTIIRA